VIALTIETPDDMERLGATVARQLRAGDLVALNGELGAGKTTLTRGLGAELGVRGAVTSPTFVLARTHPREGAAPLVHVDAYRLSSAIELDDLDIDFERSIVVVEWGAGLLDGLTDDWLSIDIVRPTGAAVPELVEGTFANAPLTSSGTEFDDAAEPRQVTLTGHGERWKDLGWVGAARN
jgi:tRNA threonylcarbamoyladenosine biosynthesis protein TsaE